jgi:cobalt/nickel transport system permease protein
VLAGAAANLVFLRNTVFYLGPLAVTAGMVSFASILFRAFLAVTAALLLSALVPFPLLVRQITRMGLPKIFGLQLFLTWRYLSVLLAEAGTMYTAYLLRSKNAKGVKMKDMGSFLGNLLIRSFDRAGRVYTAMKCRGFDGTFSVSLGHSKKPMRPADWFYAAGVSLAALFFRFFDAGRAMGRLAGRFL